MGALPSQQVIALLRAAHDYAQSSEGQHDLTSDGALVSHVNWLLRQPHADKIVLALALATLQARVPVNQPALFDDAELAPLQTPLQDSLPENLESSTGSLSRSTSRKTIHERGSTSTSRESTNSQVESGKADIGSVKGLKANGIKKLKEGESMLEHLIRKDQALTLSPNQILGDATPRFWKIASLWPLARRPRVRRAALLYRTFLDQGQDELLILRAAKEYVEETAQDYLMRFDLWLEQQPWQR
jgi:hypothetical protein